jgi:hypothetical protein
MIDGEVWINRLKSVISGIDNDRFVVPDVRFGNEAAWLREEGRLWHVKRPMSQQARPHASEEGLSVWPGETTFDNSGSPEDLFKQVDSALGTLHDPRESAEQ